MDTKVTDAVQPFLLESASYQVLSDTLQLLLATRPVWTLVMMVGETPDGASTEVLRTVKVAMDEVEQLLLVCFRRSDKVVRCSEAACAAILLDAEVDGALRAIHRFQRMLSCWPPLAVPLRVGVAAASEQPGEGQPLLALALQPRLRILPAPEAGQESLPRMDELAPNKPAMSLPAPKGNGVQEKAGKVAAQMRDMLAASTAAALSSESAQHLPNNGGSTPLVETFTRARARALGVPYIAPPRHIPNSVRNLLPAEVMRQLHCLPIGRDRNALTVALADPTDQAVLRRLEQLTGLTIFPVMTDPDALETLAQPGRSRRASQVSTPSENRPHLLS